MLGLGSIGQLPLGAGPVAVANVYSIAADYAGFALSGQASAGYHGFAVIAARGSFALTGQAAGLRATWPDLLAEAGAFALTGEDADLERIWKLRSAVGSFALTGQAASFRATRVLRHIFTQEFTNSLYWAIPISGPGIGVRLKWGRNPVPLTHGSFALTGQDAALRRGYGFPGAYGSFAFSGQAASLLRGFAFDGGYGAFGLTGQDVEFITGLAANLRIWARLSGAWSNNLAISARLDGEWHEADKVWRRREGAWQLVWQ